MNIDDLDQRTKGRIDGLLEAADHLIEKRADHEEWKGDSNDAHHNACANTCSNMAKELQREALEAAMEAVGDE